MTFKIFFKSKSVLKMLLSSISLFTMGKEGIRYSLTVVKCIVPEIRVVL